MKQQQQQQKQQQALTGIPTVAKKQRLSKPQQKQSGNPTTKRAPSPSRTRAASPSRANAQQIQRNQALPGAVQYGRLLIATMIFMSISKSSMLP
jgi:hypothetical protein